MLTEGKWKGGNGHVKSSSGRKRPSAPPPPLRKSSKRLQEKFSKE